MTEYPISLPLNNESVSLVVYHRKIGAKVQLNIRYNPLAEEYVIRARPFVEKSEQGRKGKPGRIERHFLEVAQGIVFSALTKSDSEK